MTHSPIEFADSIHSLVAGNAHSVASKRMWINWLSEYNTPGYYKRKGSGYDASFAYNHVQNAETLLWLAEAAGVGADVLLAARDSAIQKSSRSAQAAAVRRHVPWSHIEALLWPNANGEHAT